MRKKNNKGFMLAEAIISGTIIITSMVVLYSTFNKLYAMYTQKTNYYSIEATYATKEIINNLINKNFAKTINNVFNKSNNYILIANGRCQATNNNTSIKIEDISDICNRIKDSYSVNNMIITKYDKSVLENEIKKTTNLNKLSDGSSLVLNQTFKEYIDFVIDYYGVSNNDTEYSYLVLTELKASNGEYHYANLGIR